MTRSIAKRSRVVAVLMTTLMVSACEFPSMEVEQLNFRGLGAENVVNPRIAAKVEAANVAPDPLPPVQEGGAAATELFENIEVLGGVSANEMTRTMAAITSWVSPTQGCFYCHAAGNFASEDAPYTKNVARRMIQMTQWINREWKDHVGETGVTCYTCHRGAPVPGRIWHLENAPPNPGGYAGNKAGQNLPAVSAGLTSLPFDPYSRFLKGGDNIRIQSSHPLPTNNTATIMDTEHTYSLMVNMSKALGVNCNHCHNSRAFSPWAASQPARVNAWHAIRMVREINQDYLEPLTDSFPDNRKGPLGDVFKVECATCHNGQAKPLGGAQMAMHYPAFAAPAPEAEAGDEPMEGGDGEADMEAEAETDAEAESGGEGDLMTRSEATSRATAG